VLKYVAVIGFMVFLLFKFVDLASESKQLELDQVELCREGKHRFGKWTSCFWGQKRHCINCNLQEERDTKN
jgi:hypothetical protein